MLEATQATLMLKGLPTLNEAQARWYVAKEALALGRGGLKRMYARGEEVFYYITLYNENLPMPAKPAGIDEGILQGLYRLRKGPPGLKRNRRPFKGK